MARRPLERADVHMFGIEQHDVSVQLANVRSQLDSARGGAAREARGHSSKAKRWALAAGVLAATTHVASIFTGPIGAAATGAVAAAAAANAASAVAQGRRLSEIEALQIRHDDAVSEHAGMQAQFNEATREVGQEEQIGPNGQRVRVSNGKGQPISEGWVPAEQTAVQDKLQAEPGGTTDPNRDRQRAEVISVLRELMQSAANSSSVPTVQGEGGRFQSLLGNLGLAQGSIPSHPSTAASSSGGPINGNNQNINAAAADRRAEVAMSPRQSGLRAPTRGATATPPPNSRPSQLRRPSVAPRGTSVEAQASPPPQRAVSMLRRPATAGPGYKSMSPQPAATYMRRTALEDRRTMSPRAFGRHTQTPEAHHLGEGAVGRTSHVSLSENAIGRRLEEQLLQLLHTRMDITKDEAKREELRVLASQLRQATRAARQQVFHVHWRSTCVLQSCIFLNFVQCHHASWAALVFKIARDALSHHVRLDQCRRLSCCSFQSHN
jgi:hypothetical protein